MERQSSASSLWETIERQQSVDVRLGIPKFNLSWNTLFLRLDKHTQSYGIACAGITVVPAGTMHYAYLHGSQAIKKGKSKHLLLHILFLIPPPGFLLFASNIYYDVWIRNVKVKKVMWLNRAKHFISSPSKFCSCWRFSDWSCPTWNEEGLWSECCNDWVSPTSSSQKQLCQVFHFTLATRRPQP